MHPLSPRSGHKPNVVFSVLLCHLVQGDELLVCVEQLCGDLSQPSAVLIRDSVLSGEIIGHLLVLVLQVVRLSRVWRTDC